MAHSKEHRLIYRRASSFGYTSSGQARVDTRDLGRQVQAQQQSNLGAQRTQQAEVARLNAMQADKAAAALKDGTEFTPTTFSRTGGAANVGTGIMEKGAEIKNPVYYGSTPENPMGTGEISHWDIPEEQNPGMLRKGSSVVMDRSLPVSSVDRSGAQEMSSQSGLEQSAINRLRENGKTDEEIRAIMSAPEFKQNIQQTMSNTGLPGSTARKSAVLTPAQAQGVLTTSRNPAERAAAQAALDAAASKGVNETMERPVGTDESGNTIFQTVTNPNAEKEKNDNKARLALEESNRLKAKESADELKKFTAGIDTTQIDQTKAQIDGIMASISGLSPELQAAVLPSLISLQASNNEIAAQVNAMIAAQPTDAEIEGDGSLETYIKSQDEKYKAMLAKNLETSKEVATYNRDMIQADKNIFEHDATVSEQKQMAANVQNEKQLRRQLNRLGIQTDVQGLDFLQSEIQNGVDTLENLKTANNLVSLKAQLAIGKGYSIEVKQALEGYEANYLNITSQTTEKLQTAKNSISTAKAERNKEIIAARMWGLKQKQENDKELRGTIIAAHKTMNDDLKQAAKDRQDGIIKTKDTLGFISDISKEIGGNKMVQNARTVMTQFSALEAEYSRAQASTKEGKQFSDQALISLFNKILDPTSVVREAEYNRSSENMALADRMWSKLLSLRDGGVLTPEVRTELFNAAQTLSDTYNTQLEDEYQPYISRANVFNGQDGLTTKVRLEDIFPPSLIPYISEDQQRTIEIQMGSLSGDTAGVGSFSQNAPAGGFRTDRHNNPTAMTTDVARTAGLVEGVDYTKGDAFPDNPNLFTARLIGDPIQQTIKAIDQMGFYTQKGQQRWTHTAISKNEWNAMSPSQKESTVVAMYQKEGGTGTLAQGVSGGGTQSTDGPTPDWVASIGPVVLGSPYHKGKDVFAIDIDGKIGDPIPSSVSGKVVSVDNIGSGAYGKNVVIQDAMGYSHLFAHMDSVDVAKDSSVNAAQSLGKMGNTGNVIPGKHGDGSHLHYRITDKSGQPVSYNEYLAFSNEAKGTGKTQYSLTPSAHASEPHDSIYIEPETEATSEPAPEPKKAPPASIPPMGRTLSMPGGIDVGSSMKLKVLGAFRNISTGEVVYPTDPKKVSFYQSKPAGWKDLNKDEPTVAAKSFVLTGDPSLNR